MQKASLLVLAAAACLGQTPPPAEQTPPPEVDSALRARITQFYQLEVAGKFSKALDLVAEDTKDLFIESSKPTYTSFEIRSIKYYDDFSKAEVMMMVSRLMPLQGFMGHPLASKMNSRWKLENGVWYFFVDPQKDLPSTPFGGMPLPGSGHANAAPPGAPAALGPVRPPPMPAHLADASQLQPDKVKVQLKASGSSEQVTIPNTSPWQLTLAVADPKLPGVDMKLSTSRIAPRQKAVLTINTIAGATLPKAPITVLLTVQETKQAIPITLSFVN